MKLLKELNQNPFLLAPMAGITDCAFRTYMRELGAGIVVTELVSATGLKFSSERTKKLMRFEEVQHPVGIQLFGEDLEALSIAAKEVEQMGADFVDLNFGCPVPKVVKKGAGSAVLKDLVYLRDVLRTVKAAVSIPVTIKVRTGWDANTRNTHEVSQIAFDEGITWVAIHGRTRAQGYSGSSDWEYIQQVKNRAKLPILGNGDIQTPEKAVQRLAESGCDGVLIGRGCLKNPWIFKQSLKLWNKQKNAATSSSTMEPDHKDFKILFGRLYEHLSRYEEEKVIALQIKKLAAWYSAGYPDSAVFRQKIFQVHNPKEALKTAVEYFDNMNNQAPQDTSHESFLMGGHG